MADAPFDPDVFDSGVFDVDGAGGVGRILTVSVSASTYAIEVS